ncbi:putative GAF sensor protein [Mycobacterium lentiflavum]|uniref:Putative GAF sensor protein n=1 Tax=Mycobacterium lentiflavum TaxID=141349 RepID=A0A0E4H2A0_MYCLN|nr:helix-turn-helix domain-containing protein [Mycobacterium lentiflavum]CQD23975.1 putative GAF sensor protein [Mycobacterium lentiflavum]
MKSELWLSHHAVIDRADRLASRAADLIEASLGRPTLVLHSGAIESAQIELELQERGQAELLSGGSVEFLHRGAGRAGLCAAAVRIADQGTGAPRVLVIHAQGSDSALAADRDDCALVADLFPGFASVTCLFAGPHAASAGLSALLRHTVLWADGTELGTRSPEGRLLLLDHLLDQLDTPAQVRHLAISPAISALSGSAVDRLVARRLRALSPALRPPSGPSASGALNCAAVCGALAGSDGLLAEMLAAASSHAADELLLEDAEFTPIIWHPPDRSPSSLSMLITAGRLRRLAEHLRPGIPELVRLGTPAAGCRIVTRLGSKEPLGYLSAVARGGNTDSVLDWLRHLVPVAAAEIAHRASWPRLNSETRRQTVSLLAKGALSRPSATLAVDHLVGPLGARVAALDGIRPADSVSVSAPHGDRGDFAGRLGRTLDSLGLAHGEHMGLVVALVDADDRSVDRLLSTLPRAVAVGLGSTVHDSMELASSARQAIYACQLAVNTRQRFLNYAAIGLHRLLLPGAEASDDPQFEEPIRRLEQAATTLRFDGCQTLASYLNTGGNLRRASHDLVVHANTLRYRLDRIAEIMDVDLNDPEQCFRLQLVIRLRASRRSLAESGLLDEKPRAWSG